MREKHDEKKSQKTPRFLFQRQRVRRGPIGKNPGLQISIQVVFLKVPCDENLVYKSKNSFKWYYFKWPILKKTQE